jgi:glycosyltransferase involved in cell wall biosynthesis
MPSGHEFIFFVDAKTMEGGSFPGGVEYVVVPTDAPATQAASANGNRSLRDIWRMSSATSAVAVDVMFYPSVYTYYPIFQRTTILLGVHDVIAENYAEVVFPRIVRRFLWRGKGVIARRQADYIVTVSEYARSGIIQRYGWPEERVWVVAEAPDAIFQPISDPEQIRRALLKVDLDPTMRFIAYLGGLNPHKNLRMLVEVLAEMRSEPDFSDVQLVLVGPADSDTFTPGISAIQAVVTELELSEAVHFTGYLADREVAGLLNAAQVLVLPSLEEGFGLPAVEAAACGTPIVATRNSPLPHLLEGGGLFIDPTDAADLKGALMKILSNKSLQEELGTAALERARALTWELAGESFLRLLDRVAVESS